MALTHRSGCYPSVPRVARPGLTRSNNTKGEATLITQRDAAQHYTQLFRDRGASMAIF